MLFLWRCKKKEFSTTIQNTNISLLLFLTFLGRLPLQAVRTIALVLFYSDGVFAGHDVCLSKDILLFSSTLGHVRTLVFACTREGVSHG